MERFEIEGMTADEFTRVVEQSASEAVDSRLADLKQVIHQLKNRLYLQKTWLTLEEAAKYADITTTTLREWRSRGLPESQVGGRTYVKREELDDFIAGHAEG